MGGFRDQGIGVYRVRDLSLCLSRRAITRSPHAWGSSFKTEDLGQHVVFGAQRLTKIWGFKVKLTIW